MYGELLDVHNIDVMTNAEGNFKEVENAVQENNLQWTNLKCIITDSVEK